MRNLDPAFAAALAQSTIRPAFLVELEFRIATRRYWSGIGNLAWHGRTFQGVGGFGAISSVEEQGELKAGSITYELRGIPIDDGSVELLELADKFTASGGTARLWFGALTATGVLAGEPWPLSETIIDVPLIRPGPDAITISISTETRLSRQQSRQGRRYTHEDQQLDYPGDLFFEFINELQDKTLS